MALHAAPLSPAWCLILREHVVTGQGVPSDFRLKKDMQENR